MCVSVCVCVFTNASANIIIILLLKNVAVINYDNEPHVIQMIRIITFICKRSCLIKVTLHSCRLTSLFACLPICLFVCMCVGLLVSEQYVATKLKKKILCRNLLGVHHIY